MKKLILFLTLVTLLVGGPLLAQSQPVVYAVLIYSPTCPHCEDVIVNHLPGIVERFGDQLHVLFIDISTQGGQLLADSAYTYYAIPPENHVVPMLIIGDQVLLGSIDIPNRMPTIVEAGLANGGIGLPTFPGLREAYAASQAQQTQTTPAASPTEETAAETLPPALSDRLSADPVGNVVALLVLAGLAASLITVVVVRPLSGALVRAARLMTLAAGLVLTVTLVFQADALALVLAGGSLIALALAGFLLLRRNEAGLILLVALVGLIDAGYLAYVELTQVSAACGVVGDCNAVQQSPYAQIFGVPIGVIGLAGYLAVLLVWLLDQRFSGAIYRRLLFWMALAGTAFSLYLTFLELYIIGAVCAWCLLSAVMMLALLWLAAPVSPEVRPARA